MEIFPCVLRHCCPRLGKLFVRAATQAAIAAGAHRKGTAISNCTDEERGLLFTLRSAFVQVLQQKAIFELAKENLSFYDRVLQVSSDRFKAGDIARIDLDRLQLQRVMFESDLQTAEVNLSTAKIQLLMLLNDRTPVSNSFAREGLFRSSGGFPLWGNFRKIALETRPDLRAAVQSMDQALTNCGRAESKCFDRSDHRRRFRAK